MTLENLDNPRQNDSQTVSPKEHATEEAEGGPSGAAIPPQPQPTAHPNCDSHHHRYESSPRWKDWLEGIALFAGIGYAIVTFCMWRDAHDNFIVNQRAWVGADRPVSLDSIILGSKHSGKVSYVITLKNFGNTIALSTAIWSEAISGWDRMKPAMDDSCFRAAVLSRGKFNSGNIPKVEFPKNMSNGLMFQGDTIGRHFRDIEIDVGSGNSPSPLTIIGCVVYRDQFGKERQTRMCYGGSGELEKIAAPLLLYQCPLGDNDAN